ncbi:MarR family transcriptional regulator [Pendulispora rubella]|uniref:MarR family transcriptional regulator n=1 Tax=Pendulispora rubella TaxID=2741070 RepID=A0ABZ2L4V4_9BACT
MQSRPSRPPIAFLLTQVGSHAAGQFAERLAPLDLSPPHAGILRAIAVNAGMSQQALSGYLHILPSRLVTLVDELQERGLIERRDSPEDRRVYALHLTAKGQSALEAIGRIGREHESAVCAPLDDGEREQLGALLLKIANAEGLMPGVHPGFGRMGPPRNNPGTSELSRGNGKLRRTPRRGK